MQRICRLCFALLVWPILAWGQASVINGNRVHAGWVNYGITAGTGTAYTLTFSPALPGYVTGQCFLFKPHVTNTGAATLNVQAKGALALIKESGGIFVPLVAGDLLVNRLVQACHDGTNLQLMGAAPDASSGLPSDPGPCLSNAFVTDVAQDGTLTCTQPSFATLSGSATDAQIPDLNTLGTGLTISRCVETDGTGKLGVAAGACGVSGGSTGISGAINHGLMVATGGTTGSSLGVATNGQLPIGSTGADPVLGTLTGTANQLTVTNGPGTITLSIPTNPTLPGTTTANLGNATGLPFATGLTGTASDAQIPNLNTLSTGLTNARCVRTNNTTGLLEVAAGDCGTATAAPLDATYWTSSLNGTLTNEVSLGQLTTGLLKHAVSGGVSTPATAIAGTDFLAPGGALGTPASGILTNATGLPLTTGVVGDLPYSSLTPATTSSRMLGRSTPGAGDWEELTPAQIKALLGITFGDITGTASDAQTPDLNTVTTGLTPSRCVETDATGKLGVAAGTCGVAGGSTGISGATNHGLMVATGGTTGSSLGVATNGQIPIGSAGADPALALPQGTANQLEVIPGPGSLLWRFPPAGVTLPGTTTANLGNATGLPLTTGVSGDLPYANLTPPSAPSRLLGRGTTAGDWQEVILGTNLAMSGTTLNATGGGGGGGDVTTATSLATSVYIGDATLGHCTFTEGGVVIEAACDSDKTTLLTSDIMMFGSGPMNLVNADGDICATTNNLSGITTYHGTNACQRPQVSKPFDALALNVGTGVTIETVSLNGWPGIPVLDGPDTDAGTFALAVPILWKDFAENGLMTLQMACHSIPNQNGQTLIVRVGPALCHAANTSMPGFVAPTSGQELICTFGPQAQDVQMSNTVTLVTTGCTAGERMDIPFVSEADMTAGWSTTTAFITGGLLTYETVGTP